MRVTAARHAPGVSSWPAFAVLAAVAALAVVAPRARAADVALYADPACADAAERARLADALAARLPELVVTIAPSAEAAGRDGIVWSHAATGPCTLALETLDGPASVPLGPRASDADVEGAAARLAWWLELRARHAAIPGGPLVVTPPRPTAARERPPSVLVAAELGAAFYPTPGGATGLLRVSVSFPLAPELQLGLDARLGTALDIPSPLDVDALDRSVGLVARYEARLSERWRFSADLAARWAFAELNADFARDVRPRDALSNVMLAIGCGLAWPIEGALRVRLDATLALALAQRRLTSDEGAAGDLGSVVADVALGFELLL